MAARSQTLPTPTSSTNLLREPTMSVPSDNMASSATASGGSTVGSPTSTAVAPPTAAGQQQASPARRQGLMSSITRNIFGTSSRDRSERNSLIDLVTQEGSIKKEAWTLISRGNTNKTRVRTLLNLQEPSPRTSPLPMRRQPTLKHKFARIFDGVMKNRNLQVSTLEGIWHETQDMLNDPDTKDATLKAIIELTITQHQQLGLALRHTFFEKIRDMGCEDGTIKWLNALSENCKNVNGFEKAMDFLVADWMQSVLSQEDCPEAYKVIQLAEQLVMHNSAFVCEASMITLVRSSCSRCARLLDPLTSPCLDLLTMIQKFSEMPRSELALIVTTLCCLVVVGRFCEQSWSVARNLLNSQLGHRTRNILVDILKSGQHSLQIPGTDRDRVIRSLRGAVYFLVQSTWGTQKIESVRASPAFVTDALECAVGTDAEVCNDVLKGIKRLVSKYGRDLQHITWQRIVRMFHVVHEMIKVDESYSLCRPMLTSLLDQLEQLYLDNQYTGLNDELFELLESCLDCRCDDSIMLIMNYRGMVLRELAQLQPDWLLQAKALVEKYADKSFSRAVRKQAIALLLSVYTQCRSVSEHEIVTTLLLPLLGQLIPVEEECEVQYQMALTLFEICRCVSVRPGESALFDHVLEVIRKMFVDGLPKCFEASPIEMEGVVNYNSVHQDNRQWGGFCMENQEIVVRDLDELLMEKWPIIPASSFRYIIDMLTQNVFKQYQLRQFNEAGSEVRAAIFNVLFNVRACPITGRLVRMREDDPSTAVQNVFIRLFNGKEGEYSWCSIADAAVQALKMDRSWPVTYAIISGLAKVLEHTEMVRTAGEKNLSALVEALLHVTTRATRGEYFYKDYDEALIEKSRREANQERLRLLPIVLATMIGFTVELGSENRSHELCRQIVDYAKQGSVEAIIASSIALQRVPDGFASFAPLFVELLSVQQPVHGRAIPVLEFFTDAAHVEQFHKFFQPEHFKQVADCLAPYTVVEFYNPFIVTLAHRALMMWFSVVPERMRPEVRTAMLEKVHGALEHYYKKEGMSRQPSGDGRNEGSSMYVLGGAPDTPPPMGGPVTARATASEEISEEIERALSAFFWLGKIDDIVEDTSAEKGMTEIAQEHFLVNDHILTVRTLAEKEEDDVFSAAAVSSSSTSTPTTSSAAAAAAEKHGSKEYDGSATPKTFAEQRRRYQSAIQSASNRPADGRRAMDDMDVERSRERSWTASRPVSLPQVTYTQLTVRSMYGKRSWMMRSLEMVHVDYEMVRGISEDATSLMQHVAGLPTACQVGKKNDEAVATRLRNMDRIPGLELFAVGVLFKAVGQTSEADFLRNCYGSERYCKFIKMLGDLHSLTNSPNQAGLLKDKHGKYTYEYKEPISRVVFLIAALMPNMPNDPQCNEKKKLIGNNFVTVLFNESGAPYQLQHNSFVHCAIEITPVDPINLMIYVHARPEILCWIGLRKVVLPDMLVARTIRQIVIRANLAVNVYRSLQESPDQPYLSMAILRLRTIRLFKDKCQPVSPLTAS